MIVYNLNLNASIDYYTNNVGNIGNTGNNGNNGNNGNSWSNVSNSGNSNSGSYIVSNNGSYGGSNGGAYSGAAAVATGGLAATTTENIESSSEDKNVAIKKEFLKYNNLCTDSEKNIFVFRDIEKSCKVVIHYDKDEILAVEHYYQYPTQKEATDSMSVLKEQYGNKFEDVLRETNALKVIIDKSEYKDLTTTNLIEQYKKSGNMIAIMEKSSLPND